MLLALALILALNGCSAIEVARQQSSTATAPNPPGSAAFETEKAQLRATGDALQREAARSAATVAALTASQTAEPTRVEKAGLPASASASVYGSVPIDSDRLNIIAALAIDAEGALLAATRAGEIYRLPDSDGDGLADETRLIFADADQELDRVRGMTAGGAALLLLHGPRLSLLRDADGDGVYAIAAQLDAELPADSSALQASNGLVQAADGRLFSADLHSGEILLIRLRE